MKKIFIAILILSGLISCGGHGVTRDNDTTTVVDTISSDSLVEDTL